MDRLLTLFVLIFISFGSIAQEVKHIVLIGIDGFSSASLERASMPTISRLMNNGAYTLKKRSVLPSSSAPNWASMFMGVPTEIHGYTQWGSKESEIPYPIEIKNNIFPTIFQVLRESRPDYELGCLYEWDGIKHLVDTLSLNYHAIAENYIENEKLLADLACKYIKEKRPNFLAVIFDGADHAGHQYGYASEEYYNELNFIDGEISRILDAVVEAGFQENTIVIVTSDHGGVEKSHGGITLDEIETPFVIYGRGIKKGCEISEFMMQYDVASVVVDIFNLSQPYFWRGRTLDSIRDYNTSVFQKQLSTGKHARTNYYDAQGRIYDQEPSKGIYVKRIVNSDGVIEVEKYYK